ncbi:MAG TPA: alpha/beta hydrolase [Pyrinomonadaceae bacterium]|jgi:pimeloyl-ACP methyl ester carboxylesterase|nr:alpha/beta hydrolase [Pyrinomonadaceae bacterium]
MKKTRALLFLLAFLLCGVPLVCSAQEASKAPVLVVHGEADPIPVASSEAWARAFPNGRLLLVKGAGHLPQVEQPEVFFGAVEAFLKGGRVPGAR